MIKSVIAVGFVSAIPNMEVAFRKGSKESIVALWKHEFFAVYKTKGKRKGKGKAPTKLKGQPKAKRQ